MFCFLIYLCIIVTLEFFFVNINYHYYLLREETATRKMLRTTDLEDTNSINTAMKLALSFKKAGRPMIYSKRIFGALSLA